MEASDTRVVVPPDEQLLAVREWLWRHSSQPNGDPWDGDPEHLDRATRNLTDLIQSFLATHPSTSAAACTDTLPTQGPCKVSFAPPDLPLWRPAAGLGPHERPLCPPPAW